MKVLKKDSKGFTLVEILTAITILGILSVIAIAGVQTIINSGKNKYYKSLKEMIISAAKEYYSDHKNELPVDIDETSDPLYLSTLVNDDYLDPVKDANGKACADSSTITVYKTGAKEYEYLLSLSCPKDPNMPKDINDQPTAQKGTINVVCQPSTSKKKASAYLQLTNRSDYRYEVLKKNKDGKWEEVANKKGNIKNGKDIVNIPLNYGSGKYKVRAETGSGTNKSEDSCEEFEIQSPEPDCDGIEYEVNHVAKEWFKGTLETTITTDEEKMERYNIHSIEINYIDIKSKKTIESTGKKTVDKNILNNGLKLTYTKDKDVTKGELSVTIYNDAKDHKECKLGEYWMDNKPPTCVVGSDKRVNAPQDKVTWTNRKDAKVTIDCDDKDNNGENGSGCRQTTYEDTTEDKFANFNRNGKDDEIYIEDNVGNTPDDDGSCKDIVKLIDRTAPRCSSVSKYAEHDWGKDYKAWSRCADDVKKNVTPSECTTETVYQEEGAPDGETKTFTIKDNAGNTTPCLADKHRDNVAPICTGNKLAESDWTNSSSVRAKATCNDSQGAGKSGCIDKVVSEGDKNDYNKSLAITDGRNMEITVKDWAGNTATCTADKNRDRVPPECVRGTFRSELRTNPGTCSSHWSTTYTNPDVNASPQTVVQEQGITKNFTNSCWINSVVDCSDNLSGCKARSFNNDTYSNFGYGDGDCYYQGCCDNVRSADCSNLKPATIQIEDRANNKTYCDGTFNAPKPVDEKIPDKEITKASCNLLSITPTGSSGISWLTIPSVDVNVSWDPRANISVEYNPGETTLRGTVKNGSGNMNIHFGNGVYAGGEIVVTDSTGYFERCYLGDFYIDDVPPTGDFTYRTTNVLGTGTNDRCLGSIDNAAPLADSINAFAFSVRFNNVHFTDVTSGVQYLNYQLSPTFIVVKDGLPNLNLTTDQPTDGKPIWTTNVIYGSIDPPGGVLNATANAFDLSSGINMNGFSEAYHGGKYCYEYCVAVSAVDAAGNSYQAGSYGTDNSPEHACSKGWVNHDD